MKFFLALLISITVQQVMANPAPALYCVSLKSYPAAMVNQINVFTNKKGTLRINLQFTAVNDSDADDVFNVDTKMIQTVTRLQYDEKSGVFYNGANKLQFQVSKQAMTPEQTKQAFAMNHQVAFDWENMPGHKVEFKKYYPARFLSYNLIGHTDKWDRVLAEAYKAGVIYYICGNADDMIGARKSPLDGLLGSDD